jgi:hypothetical protein
MAVHTPKRDTDGLQSTATGREELPQVLLIGDSISIGYTAPVRRLLNGVCDTHRPDANCGDTRNGLAHLDSWLGDRVWDLIHFNWGLHDLCYRHPEATVYGSRDKINGTLSVAPETYRADLDQLVRRMLPRAKRLVWATTTCVPEGEAGRHQGDEVRYNALAAEVMAEHGIPTDDLFAITQAFPPAMFACPGDVHFTPGGCEEIARAVSECIRRELAKRS